MFISERLIMFVVALTGSLGQAIILWHDLVDTYPYKMMSHPSDWLYGRIGVMGFIAGVLVSFFLAWYLSGKIVTWTAAITTLACPLTFLLLFVGLQMAIGVDWHSTDNFDHTTPMAVLKEFAQTIFWLGLMGSGFGLFCGGIVKTLVKRLNPKRSIT